MAQVMSTNGKFTEAQALLLQAKRKSQFVDARDSLCEGRYCFLADIPTTWFESPHCDDENL